MPDTNNSPVRAALYALLETRADDVKAWLRDGFAQTPPCFYSSVDVRHSGQKLVPVDTNLFPAGFNHLSAPSQTEAIAHIQGFIARQKGAIQRVLIIPENHTRNLGYLSNLQALKSLFERAGFEAQIGRLDATETLTLEDAEGRALLQHPLQKDGNCLCTTDGFKPDMIVVNNDLTSGSPEILKGITQLIVPAIGQGWYRRKKSIHFDAYAQVARQFAAAFNLDQWLIAAEHHKCGRVNFKERQGIECVALGVDKLLRKVAEKYAQYGIDETPYAFIKADSGTYGMGIMIVRSGDEVIEMNKKSRNKMNTTKEGAQTSEVIIQEGVPTIDEVDGGMAEPMVYLIDGHPVGGAYRVNAQRDAYNNLNAAGMHFVPMCVDASQECMSRSPIALISQLATLAAAREEYGEEYSI
jgi:glutamate--cysteine ligase